MLENKYSGKYWELPFDILPHLNWCKTAKIISELTYLYSHLSNKLGGWNKPGGSAKYAKSLNVEVGINLEGGILRKKLIHNANKRGVEGGKDLRNQ